MEITVRHLGEVQFEAEARGHKVICDQPMDNGGYDEGMTPPEFMLISLGTCAGFYVAQYFSAHGLSCEGLEVKVAAEKARQPARLGSFRIEIISPCSDAQHEEGIRRAVEKCLIHNTLLHAPQIETVIRCAALQS